jgi:hypothetical protein
VAILHTAAVLLSCLHSPSALAGSIAKIMILTHKMAVNRCWPGISNSKDFEYVQAMMFACIG